MVDPAVQLLHKLSIRGVNGPEKLLKVIKVSYACINLDNCSLPWFQNPITDHLPINTVKLSTSRVQIRGVTQSIDDRSVSLALSGDSPTIRLSRYLPKLPETHSIAVFIGAMARGKDDFADGVVDDKISISDYPLSASVACGKVRKLSQIHRESCIDQITTVLLRSRRTVGHCLTDDTSSTLQVLFSISFSPIRDLTVPLTAFQPHCIHTTRPFVSTMLRLCDSTRNMGVLDVSLYHDWLDTCIMIH
jgi:hypothetical protein